MTSLFVFFQLCLLPFHVSGPFRQLPDVSILRRFQVDALDNNHVILRQRAVLGQPGNCVTRLAVSFNGKVVACQTKGNMTDPSRINKMPLHNKADSEVVLHYVATGESQVLRHDAPVGCFKFSPDGKYLVTSTGASHGLRVSLFGELFFWDVSSGCLVHKWAPPILGGVQSFALSSDSKRVAIGSVGSEITITDLFSAIANQRLSHHNAANVGYVEMVTFSPDGKSLLSINDSMDIWDVGTSRLRKEIPHVTHAVYSIDNKLLAVSCQYEKSSGLTVVSPLSGEIVYKAEFDNSIVSMAFSPDSMYLVLAEGEAVSGDGHPLKEKITILNSNSWQAVISLPNRYVGPVAFSSDGTLLCCCHIDGRIVIWEPIAGKNR